MSKFNFKLTGVMPLLMHSDDYEAADMLKTWREAPENKNKSQRGDDRSPAWTWQTYVYHDNTEIVNAIKTVSDTLDRGDVVSWTAIERVTGVTRTELRYVILKWKKHMYKDRQIEVWAEHGVGYRLLLDSENITIAATKRAKSTRRQQNKALRALRNTRQEQLNDHERLQWLAIRDALLKSRKQMTNVRKFTSNVSDDRMLLLARYEQQISPGE